MKDQNQNSIYQAGYAEIFIKNFLAGIARGLGNLFAWFVIMFIGYKLLWPQLASQINRLNNLVENLQSNPIIQKNQQIPEDLNQLFNQYVPR